MKTGALFLSLLLLGFPTQSQQVSSPDYGNKSIINVAVIVDKGSWVGKVVESCITMAVSDFHNLHGRYRSRVALHVRDSRGDSLQSISAALELLENVELHAIIIAEITNEELFLIRLAENFNVLLLTFSSVSSSSEHPYFIQVAEDENYQFHGITAFLKAFGWRSFVVLYEDTGDARQAQTYINDILQENHLDVGLQTAISPQATDDQIINDLSKLMATKASIYLVHLSPSLASRVFMNAKLLGMMDKGFAWVVTSKTMNVVNSQGSLVYESMQGVLGFKSHIPMSGKIQRLTWRLRGSLHNESDVEFRELNTFGVRAYDTVWALAEAIGRAGINLSQNCSPGKGLKQLESSRLCATNISSTILRKITSSNFTGLLGKFQLADRKLVPGIYEIVNVIGKGQRRVGFWTSAVGLTKELNSSNYSSNILETIIWPGFSSTAPERRLVQRSGKVLRIGIPANVRFPELVDLDKESTVKGFCIDVFETAIATLSYQIPFEYIPIYNYTYDDLIHQVYLQNIDAAVGDITINSRRSAIVDFTIPYSEMGLGILVKLDDKDPWFFLKPLNAGLWITSACFFLLMGFIIWLIEHRINEEFQGPPAQQIGTALWFAVSTLVYAHRQRLESNASRFVMGVWLFVVLILTSSYIAQLSSLLTVKQIQLTNSDYIGYPANSFGQELNVKDNRFRSYEYPEDYDKAMRKGSKNGGVGAIIDELPYLKLLVARYPHDYTIIQSSVTTNGFGFAFPKGSPLAPDVSRAIAGLRETVKLEQIEKEWFSGQTLLSDTEQTNKPSPLSTEEFFGLFLISGLSMSIAVIILLIFLLREKLSIFFRGKLMGILRYLQLHGRMTNILAG